MITRIKLVIAVICLIVKTTQGNANGNQFIAGPGTTAAILGQFPSFVVIQLNNGQCGGFIINTNHIVTAGSCVLDANHNLISAAGIQAIVGSITLTPPHAPINIDRIYVHPLYNPWTFDNDIAVLRTIGSIPIQEGPSSNIFPADLNDRILFDQQPCTFVGMTVANPSLQFIQQQVMSHALCNTAHNHRVAQSQFCAGANVPAGPCLINRGGPLICNNRVSGILSNGFSCNTQTQPIPGVYTQVRRYIPWIVQQFNRTDLTPPGPTPPPTFPLLSGQSTIVGYMSLIVLSVLCLILAG